MEFSSAEADYQEAAKKDVANQLTVSINKQRGLRTFILAFGGHWMEISSLFSILC